jgi:hypothetical protein
MSPSARQFTAVADTETVDPSWKGLYRAGGASALIVGIVYIIITVLFYSLGPPPGGGTAEPVLKWLAGQALRAQTTWGLFILTDLLLVPAIPALYLVLKGINKSAMIVAVSFFGLFAVLDLGVTLPTLVALTTLSQNYAGAVSDLQRAAYTATAVYAIAAASLSQTLCSFVVPSIGSLVASLVMMKGIFSKVTAYLGLAASLVGIFYGFSIFIPALAILLEIDLPLFGIWFILAGSRVYKLGGK